MKSIRDWVFSHLVSMSLVSSRPLSGSDSFFNEGHLDEELDDQGITLPYYIPFCACSAIDFLVRIIIDTHTISCFPVYFLVIIGEKKNFEKKKDQSLT